MKKLNQYLTETKKVYPFRLKFAINIDNNALEQLESILQKYDVVSVSKATKTILQKHPLDFATIPPCEIFIVDVVLDYPVTAHDLSQYIQSYFGVSAKHLVVRDPNHPEEVHNDECQNEKDTDKDAESLLDSEYKVESNEPSYGDAYNEAMLANIEAARKEREFSPLNYDKDPSSEVEHDSHAFTKMPEGSKSPIGS